MDNDSLSVVKSIEKDILKKLLAVCEENNLRIFADGGTLLGTVREKHFISYDDDIDMAMLREDYDRLMEIGPECFEYPYFFQSAYTDEGYFREHIQIRRTDTCGALKTELDYVPFNQGIFVDVFPFDGVPDSEFKGRIQWFKIRFFKKLLNFLYNPVPSFNPVKRVIKKLFKPLGKLFDRKRLYKRFEKVCKKYSASSDTITLLSFNAKYKMRLLDKNWYNKTVYLPFDELSIPCPEGCENVLERKFGDWKTPREGSIHGDIIFDTEKSYEEIKNKNGV
jgi:lipopolysaccharide cholinephosphotransferase